MTMIEPLPKQVDLLTLGLLQEKQRTTKLSNALEHIIEYWNRDENPGAMSDALWHILETAETALKDKEDIDPEYEQARADEQIDFSPKRQ